MRWRFFNAMPVAPPRVRWPACLKNCRLYLEELEPRLAPSVDVLGYRNDSFSTGQQLNETVLTPANVNVAHFGKLFSTPVDGYVYAQPLYKTGVNISVGPAPGTHNVAYVATEHDSVYAIDADDGQVLWKDSLINPAAGATPVPTVDVGAVLQPEIGITSTPVIDPAINTLYVVAYTKEVRGGANHYVYRLYGLNLTSGQVQFGGQLLIADTIFDGVNFTYVNGPAVNGTGAGGAGGMVPFNAARQLQRPGLTLLNGTVYVAFGSHNDLLPTHGWLLGFNHADPQNRLQLVAAINTTPNGSLGTIWQSGGQIAADNNGNLYVVTGNGTFESTLDANGFPVNGDYGDAVVKLALDPSSDPTHQNKNGWGLKVVDYFSPHNQQALANADLDLGSGGALLLPNAAGSPAHPHLLATGGKDGTLYLLDRDNLGKFNPGTDHVVQVLSGLFPKGIWGPPAYFNGAIYIVGGGTVGSAATTVSIANAHLSARPSSLSADAFGYQGSVPSISANGAGSGIVWDLDRTSAQLRAYDATSYAGELYASAHPGNPRDNPGTIVKFTLPTIANGHVYLGTTNAFVAYGLLGPRTSAPAAPSGLSATATAANQVRLTWTDNSNDEDHYDIQLSIGGITFTSIGSANIHATSYFVNGLQLSTAYTFRVRAVNDVGASPFSTPAVVLTPSTPVNSEGFTLPGGFSGIGSLMSLNGSAKIAGSLLQLTDGGPNEAGSAFFIRRVDTAAFTTQFSFQLPSASADGFTFTVQTAGLNALGAGNGGLGYQGIPKSVAVKFDLSSTSGEGPDSTGIYTNGAPPTSAGSIDLTPTGVDLHSGHVFNVTLRYDGAVLRSVISDASTGLSAAQAYPIDIPTILGDTTGFVGFTGGDGSRTAVQSILRWTYSSPSITAAPPKNLRAASSDSQVQLQWAASTGATSYNIYRGTSPGGEAGTPYATGVTATSFTDSGTAAGTTYAYRVAAANFGGVSFRSNEALVLTAPAAPTLTLGAMHSGAIPLSWSAPPAAVSYNIYRGSSPGGEGSAPYKTGVTGTSFSDTGSLSGAIYYRVTAVDVGGEGVRSNETFVLLPPAAPSGVSAAGGFGRVVVSWAASGSAANYALYRASAPGGEGSVPYRTGITATSFTDVGLASGTLFYYRVAAINTVGESPRSVEVAGTTAAAAPAGLGAIVAGSQVRLSWFASFGAASYNVYRAKNSHGEGGIPFQTGVTGTSFVDPRTSSGATYYYQVTAVNAGGESGKLNEASATLAPAAPAVTAMAAAGRINLTWTASAGATSYNVYRSTSPRAEGAIPYQSALTSNSFTDTGLAAGAAFYYRVTAVNAGGESSFFNEVLGTVPLFDLSQGFGSAGASIALNGSATVNGNFLQLTNGGVGQAASAFTTNRFSVGSFYTQFHFQLLNAAADGFTFCIQTAGPTALGRSGGGLGYGPDRAGNPGGIPQSVAVKFDFFDNQGEGNDSTGLYTDGAAPTVAGSKDLTSSGIDLHSGDIFTVMMNYGGGILKVSITDAVTGASAMQFYAIDIPGTVGSSTAFLGFTGATGLMTATQSILDWTFGPPMTPPLAPINVGVNPGAGQVLIEWEPSAGATSYNVYRSTTPGGEGPTPIQTGLLSPSFTDTGLVAGATYYYEVTAVNFSGESSRSTEVVAPIPHAAHFSDEISQVLSADISDFERGHAESIGWRPDRR
jgi:fibronectin type 3 domain-containing protein